MKKRRILSLVMAVLMVIGMIPAVSASITNPDDASDGNFTVSKMAAQMDEPGVYDITVTVTPKESVNVINGDVEVVFLLDTSGSMAWCTDPEHNHDWVDGGEPCRKVEQGEDSRLKVAKDSIYNTISQLNDKFKNSASELTVSVVSYSDDGEVIVDKVVVNDTSLAEIQTKLDTLMAYGGTYMVPGLKKAKGQFSNAVSSKYLIMIGDVDYSEEDYFDGFLFWGEWNYARDRIKSAADEVKAKGATIITVGFTQDISIFHEIASKDSNGDPLYFKTDSTHTLNTILNSITTKITADGIVLEDYVGDSNSIDYTVPPHVSAGIIESSSNNSIKWNLPSNPTEAMTLTYRIRVDPSKLDTGINRVLLNGITELTYKVTNGSTTTEKITAGVPTDELRVDKLHVEYYFDNVRDQEMGGILDAKFWKNGLTFEFAKPKETLNIGEGNNAKRYVFNRATQSNDNSDEIPLDFNNGTATVTAYENVYRHVVKVYYVTQEVEPDPSSTLTINFDPNGGKFDDGTTEPKTFMVTSPATDEIPDKLTVPAAPEKEYHTFAGWVISGHEDFNLNFSGELTYEQINSLATLLNLSEITFIAKYNVNPPEEYSYTVHFMINDEDSHKGSIIDYTLAAEGQNVGQSTSITKLNETTISLGLFKKDVDVEAAKGFTFVGWYHGDVLVNTAEIGKEFDGETLVAMFEEKIYYPHSITSINLLSATAAKRYDGKPLTKDEFESLEIKVKFVNVKDETDFYEETFYLKDVDITPVKGEERTYRISLIKLQYPGDNNPETPYYWRQLDVKFTGSQTKVGTSDNEYKYVGYSEYGDWISYFGELNDISTLNYGTLTVKDKEDPFDPPIIIIFPQIEITNKVIAPANFEKTTFEYDIINVDTGMVERTISLSANTSVKVAVNGRTKYMVVPKNLDVPGYTRTTISDPESAMVVSDTIGTVTVSFTHIYTVALNTVDHYAYIRGYEDGTVRPNGNITRAEVATIFYRLLSTDAKAAFETTENNFSDVSADAWYNLSVSTLAKAGIINGYPDGTFNPNGNITRAELVSLISKFFTEIDVGDSKFSDIDGHWAAKMINEAFVMGIINGYADGSFKPDQFVTRAEAMKIINGVLGRTTKTCIIPSDVFSDIKLFPDNTDPAAWYFYIVLEATNAHEYVDNDGIEEWTEVLDDTITY